MTLNGIIPAKYRKPVYVAYALVGVALGAIATAYGPDNVPEWHAVTTNVVLYSGGAFGLTAAANTIATRHVGDTDNGERSTPTIPSTKTANTTCCSPTTNLMTPQSPTTTIRSTDLGRNTASAHHHGAVGVIRRLLVGRRSYRIDRPRREPNFILSCDV